MRENAFKMSVRKSLGRPTHRWEDIIDMDLKNIGLEDVDWIHVAQDRMQ
jgi:hypothetical protein